MPMSRNAIDTEKHVTQRRPNLTERGLAEAARRAAVAARVQKILDANGLKIEKVTPAPPVRIDNAAPVLPTFNSRRRKYFRRKRMERAR